MVKIEIENFRPTTADIGYVAHFSAVLGSLVTLHSLILLRPDDAPDTVRIYMPKRAGDSGFFYSVAPPIRDRIGVLAAKMYVEEAGVPLRYERIGVREHAGTGL